MSTQTHVPGEGFPLTSLTDQEFDAEELLEEYSIGYDGLKLLCALRPDPEAMQRLDGFALANANVTGGRTLDQLGVALGPAALSGSELEQYFFSNVDMRGTQVPVRDQEPGESDEHYMTFMDREVLRRTPPSHPRRIALPHWTDAPGTRFVDAFPPDGAGVSMGRSAIHDLEGAYAPLANDAYLIRRLRGKLPNYNHVDALDRANPLITGYAVERLAAAAGSDGHEILAEFREPLAMQIALWQRGREYLKGIRHHNGEAYGRQILLKGRQHDIVYRHSSDMRPDRATLRGLRPESAGEDAELLSNMLRDLTGLEADAVFAETVLNLRAACEWQDFAGWQLADYMSLEATRTRQIAPAHLQANMIHNLRMVGKFDEAEELVDILNRRFWVDIDDEHGYYADILQDGTPTAAVHAAQALVLLAGGIVPPERKPKLLNTLRDALHREYGFLISADSARQQWSGGPSRTGNKKKDAFIQKLQTRMYGAPLDYEGEDRAWPLVCALLVEACTYSAIEEEMAGRDPGPWLELAEEARVGTIEGMKGGLKEFGYVGEKYCVTNPKKFVNGGEYGKTPETAQRGFGMSIGAFRMLAGRNLYAEVKYPRDYSWRQSTLQHALGKAVVPRSSIIIL